jgi:hypothetical protein
LLLHLQLLLQLLLLLEFIDKDALLQPALQHGRVRGVSGSTVVVVDVATVLSVVGAVCSVEVVCGGCCCGAGGDGDGDRGKEDEALETGKKKKKKKKKG